MAATVGWWVAGGVGVASAVDSCGACGGSQGNTRARVAVLCRWGTWVGQGTVVLGGGWLGVAALAAVVAGWSGVSPSPPHTHHHHHHHTHSSHLIFCYHPL